MVRSILTAGAAALLCAGGAQAATFTFTSGTAYTQNFDGLARTGTGSLASLPTGFSVVETGTSANTTYTAGTGSATAGDTYSFGAANSTDRALGTLRSGALSPTIFADFANSTGQTIIGLNVAYTGEQYRLGAAGRADRLDFAYSVNGGAFTDYNALDFSSPITTGTVGARTGSTALASTIALSVLNGQSFRFRFSDFDATGADDGLAIDNFSLTPVFAAAQPGAVPEPATWGMMLIGFGAAGSALRRRRAGAALAA